MAGPPLKIQDLQFPSKFLLFFKNRPVPFIGLLQAVIFELDLNYVRKSYL